jgi:hypothetical protein
VLVQELIAVKFELADKTVALSKLRRSAGGDPNASALRSETKDSTPAGVRSGRRRGPRPDTSLDGKQQDEDGTLGGGGAGGGSDTDGDGDGDDGDLHSREMLFLAAEEGLDEIVKGILAPACTKRHCLPTTFGHGLRRAAANGHVHVMKRLLGAGARLDVRSGPEDFLHRTCLHAAAAGGHEAAVRLVLAQCKERQVRGRLVGGRVCGRGGGRGGWCGRAGRAGGACGGGGWVGTFVGWLGVGRGRWVGA